VMVPCHHRPANDGNSSQSLDVKLDIPASRVDPGQLAGRHSVRRRARRSKPSGQVDVGVRDFEGPFMMKGLSDGARPRRLVLQLTAMAAASLILSKASEADEAAEERKPSRRSLMGASLG